LSLNATEFASQISANQILLIAVSIGWTVVSYDNDSTSTAIAIAVSTITSVTIGVALV